MEKKLPQRKPTRLAQFDYSSEGAYFITICTEDRKQILSRIVGDGVYDVPRVELLKYGKIVDKYINKMNNDYDYIYADRYVIMPNHIHMIIKITANVGGTSQAPYPTARTNTLLSKFISLLKRYCNREIGENIFQRSFHDHVIRDGDDYDTIVKYVFENPIAWYYKNIEK